MIPCQVESEVEEGCCGGGCCGTSTSAPMSMARKMTSWLLVAMLGLSALLMR